MAAGLLPIKCLRQHRYKHQINNIFFFIIGETLIADGDSIYAPKPPSMFPLMYQNSSTASSGLGSADGEVTYAPIMTSCYAPNLIYNDGKESELSTFRPPGPSAPLQA